MDFIVLPKKKKIISKNDVRRIYSVEKLSIGDICRILGICEALFYRIKRKFKIQKRSSMIEKICEQCNKKYFVYPSNANRKFCSQQCSRKSRKGKQNGRNNPYWKGGPVEKICLACKKKFLVERGEITKGYGKFCSKKCQHKFMRGKNSPIYGTHRTKEEKMKISEANIGEKNPMKKKENVKKWIESCNLKPNKTEMKLNRILQGILPGQYALNVRGNILILGGKIPDFVNVNGQKKLIELWGDYWHKGQNPDKRINYFKQFGFKTLVIWEHELINQEPVLEKINTFDSLK